MRRDPALHRHRWRMVIHNRNGIRWGARLCNCGARVELSPEDVARLLERRQKRAEWKVTK